MPYDEVMKKWKAGRLRSGGSGKVVRSQKQAVAIMLSEKRAAKAGKQEYAPRKLRLRPLSRPRKATAPLSSLRKL